MRPRLSIISIACVLLCGVGILAKQQSTLGSLRAEAASLRPEQPSRIHPIAVSASEPRTRQHEFGETGNRLEEIIEQMTDTESWQTASLEVMPALLESVADLNGGELMTLAARLGSSKKEIVVKAMLETLAAERDPRSFLVDQEEQSSHLYKTALAALARRDPAAARNVFEKSEFGRYDKAKLGTVIGLQSLPLEHWGGHDVLSITAR